VFDIVEIAIILIYLSIIFEISLFPVPSVASIYQLFFDKKYLTNNTLLEKIQKLNVWLKVLILLLPTFMSVLCYCYPFILILLSKSKHAYVTRTDHLWIILTAFVILLLGRIISLYSVFIIRKNNRQQKNSFALKTKAIFSISRNPILIGMYITYAGLLILFPYPLMFAGLAVYLINMHFRILIEESFLKWKFGEEYISYLAHTRSYI